MRHRRKKSFYVLMTLTVALGIVLHKPGLAKPAGDYFVPSPKDYEIKFRDDGSFSYSMGKLSDARVIVPEQHRSRDIDVFDP